MNEKLIREALNDYKLLLTHTVEASAWERSNVCLTLTEALASLDAEKVEYCEWVQDKSSTSCYLYKTTCGWSISRSFIEQASCQYCRKPIRINEH